MAISVIIHVAGEDAFLADLDDLPNPGHNYLLLRNMRKKDGKTLAYISDEASAFLYSWNRITFIELLGEEMTSAAAADGKPAGTKVLGFFREDEK